jgi:hypothetical protein
MKLFRKQRLRAYHHGFEDSRDGKPFTPPRLFRKDYEFGWDWQLMGALPKFDYNQPYDFEAKRVERELQRAAFRKKWENYP